MAGCTIARIFPRSPAPVKLNAVAREAVLPGGAFAQGVAWCYGGGWLWNQPAVMHKPGSSTPMPSDCRGRLPALVTASRLPGRSRSDRRHKRGEACYMRALAAAGRARRSTKRGTSHWAPAPPTGGRRPSRHVTRASDRRSQRMVTERVDFGLRRRNSGV
jgi:hypothetical protein